MGGDWGKMGFSVGPFSTLKAASEGSSGDADKDSWSVSVAYGKRYFIEKFPSDEELKDDLIKMLSLYDVMANLKELNFVTIDVGLADLKSSNELPSSVTDGAIKTLEHVKFEKRERNRKLISAAKKKLGYVCQACNFSFAKTYGDHMAKFIEAHHIVPLSSLPSIGAELTATEDDFMMLCSNCHRAIHRAGCPDLTSFIKTIK